MAKEQRPISDKCRACGGELVEEDDYIFYRRLRRAAAYILPAAIICGIWAPVFSIIRLIAEGGLGDVEGSAALFLLIVLLKKIAVGIILGAVIGILTGIWGGDTGLLLGAIVGVIGGFFVAAVDVAPLRAEAAYRWDVVMTAMVGGILSSATAYLTDAIGGKRFSKWIRPEVWTEGEKTA
ncbi:MAG: hypothetical protein AB1546_08845 [bacterium]